MKRILVLLLAGLLCGCAAEPAWENVEDITPVEPVPVAQQLYVHMPEEAAAPTFQDQASGELYLCNGYTLAKQILQSGDLEKTVKSVSGLDKSQLQILQTESNGVDRYDFVWATAAEEGLQLGRACILDDGNYHYVVSTMAGEVEAGDLRDTWQEIFESCCLIDPDINLRTGS